GPIASAPFDERWTMATAANRKSRPTSARADPLASLHTLADLLQHLGDIPPERVRLHPLPGTATEEDAIAIADNPLRDHLLCELIDGVLVERAMGTKEALLASLVGYYFWHYLNKHDRGIALGADGMVRLWPGRIRMPDAAFVSWEKLPEG